MSLIENNRQPTSVGSQMDLADQFRVAVTNVRHPASIYGLWYALCSILFFPLLVVAVGVSWVWHEVILRRVGPIKVWALLLTTLTSVLLGLSAWGLSCLASWTPSWALHSFFALVMYLLARYWRYLDEILFDTIWVLVHAPFLFFLLTDELLEVPYDDRLCKRLDLFVKSLRYPCKMPNCWNLWNNLRERQDVWARDSCHCCAARYLVRSVCHFLWYTLPLALGLWVMGRCIRAWEDLVWRSTLVCATTATWIDRYVTWRFTTRLRPAVPLMELGSMWKLLGDQCQAFAEGAALATQYQRDAEDWLKNAHADNRLRRFFVDWDIRPWPAHDAFRTVSPRLPRYVNRLACFLDSFDPITNALAEEFWALSEALEWNQGLLGSMYDSLSEYKSELEKQQKKWLNLDPPKKPRALLPRSPPIIVITTPTPPPSPPPTPTPTPTRPVRMALARPRTTDARRLSVG